MCYINLPGKAGTFVTDDVTIGFVGGIITDDVDVVSIPLEKERFKVAENS